MVANHFSKCFQEDLEGFPIVRKIFFAASVTHLRDGILDVLGQFVGIRGVGETEIGRLILQMDGYVAPPQEAVEDGVPRYFHSVHGMVIDVGDVAGEHVPIKIDDSPVGNDPHVVVPIENGIKQIEVDRGKISLKVQERDGRPKGKRIVEIKKRRKEHREK